jgi:membrane peptidoglycan carboxypeptidase
MVYKRRSHRLMNQRKHKKASKLKVLGVGLAIFTFISIVSGFFATIVGYAYIDSLIPENLSFPIASESTFIYDRHGELLYEVHGDERRIHADLEEIPKVMIDATIALEDKTFWENEGYDALGIMRSAVLNVLGRSRGSGSTLTQQLVKAFFLSPERSYERKIKEILISIRITQKYSKEEILEAYLNEIPFGNNSYGVKAAAERYLNKDSKDLTLAEAAVLAGIPQLPEYNNPFSGTYRDIEKKLLVDINNPENWLHEKYIEFSELRTETVQQAITTEQQQQNQVDQSPAESTDQVNEQTSTEDIENQIVDQSQQTLEEEVVTVEYHAIAAWKQRQLKTLYLMTQQGYITQEQAEAAAHEEIPFQRNRENIKAPHFVMYVQELLEQKYGKELLQEGGLKVYTSIDMDLQREAERILNEKFPNFDATNMYNGGVISIDPTGGQILAYVGSRDYWNEGQDGQFDFLRGLRQPGSSFKPYEYITALERGYSTGTILYDISTNFSATYRPRNYDGGFHGAVDMRSALGNSYNIPAIKIMHMAGIENTLATAEKLGVTFTDYDKQNGGLSLALGSATITMVDHATGFASIAALGQRVTPRPILKVVDRDGKILEEYTPEQREQVVDAGAAYALIDILQDRDARVPAFGYNNAHSVLGLSRQNAAKTGTSGTGAESHDSLTLGFTPNLCTLVWMGSKTYDQADSLKNSSGAMSAAPVWHDVMEAAFNIKYTDENGNEQYLVPNVPWYSMPDSVTWIKVDKVSGLLPGELTGGDTRSALILKRFIGNLAKDDVRVKLTIDKSNGLLANPITPADLKEDKIFFNIRPEIPEGDGAYWRWKQALDAWKQGKSEFNPPTEMSNNYYNNQNAPSIQLLNPAGDTKLTSSSVTVEFKATSPFDISSAEILIDNKSIKKINGKQDSYKHTFTLNSGTYTLTVRATDTNGKTGKQSITIVIDTDFKLTFVSPTSNAVMGSSSIATELTTNIPESISKIDISVDGVVKKTLTKQPYTTTLNLTDGDHTISAIATNKDSRTAQASVSITIDTSKPGAFSITSSELSASLGDTLTLSAAPTGNVNHIEFYSRLGAADPVLILDLKKSSGSVSWKPETKGTYTLYAIAYTRAGNSTKSSSVTVKIN